MQGELNSCPGQGEVLARRKARFRLVEQHHEQVGRRFGQRPQLACGVLVQPVDSVQLRGRLLNCMRKLIRIDGCHDFTSVSGGIVEVSAGVASSADTL